MQMVVPHLNLLNARLCTLAIQRRLNYVMLPFSTFAFDVLLPNSGGTQFSKEML